MRLTLTFLALAVSASSVAAQQASMVYRLGKDTLAIEQYTRTATALTGEMVQRSGAAVVRYQYRLALGKDGRPSSASLKRLQADGSLAPNTARETRFTMRADSIVREVEFADSTQRRAFAAKQALVNFPVFVFGPTEILAAIKKAGGAVDSIPALGATGNLGFTGFTLTGGDTVRLRGGPYAMALRFDANNRLMSLDGSLTTNKAMATRGNGGLDLAAIAKTMKPTGVLSVREDARAAFGPGGMVVIDYGRPLVRDRTVWGGMLVPFDSVWRAGANDATHLFTTRTLTLGAPVSGELTVLPGMYTLWVQNTRNGAFLIVNKQTGQWGTQYDASQDLGRVPMAMMPVPSHVEEFTIAVRAMGATRGAIEMSWGPSMMSVPFVLSVATQPAAARPVDPNASVTAMRDNWKQTIAYITTVAEELSEADYAYRPIATVRTFGELFGHVAGTQNLVCAAVLGDPQPPEDAVEKAAKTKAALVKALKESTAYCDKAYAIPAATGGVAIQLFGDTSTRFGALALNVMHDGEHYGNIVTYMRMKGLVPPSSRR